MPIYKIEVTRYYIAEVDASCDDEALSYVETFTEKDMLYKDEYMEVVEVRPITKDDL
jgi:hypothetical protein